jgi:TP901 family phage tail tape measure protein|tara:strand:- start:245 stop:2533 length:2289 start_codon:yes stop_codon:yes gene_type:complete
VPESVLRFRVETADANRKVAKLEDQVRKLEIALKASGGTSRKAATGMKAFSQGAGAAGVSAKALGAAVKGILGPLSLVATAAGAVVTGFKGFVEADKARAAVRTLGVDVKTLEGQLVGVVARTGGLASTNELLAASYDVASAGFGKAADITKILEASLLGAVGGMTDINTVSDAATSVMNAFGLTTDSVSKIVDGFVQTQNDGKIVVGQYASQIGRVAPIAAAAGVGIDELNAAISTVTAQGVPVESTFSGINQVIASIVKPTAEAAKAAKRLGLDFNSAAIRTKGFGGFLEDVIQKTGGSEVEITKLFGSVDALKALMPLINDDLVTFNKNLDNQKNATGAAGDAADIMGQTVSSQISQIVNNITTLVRGLDQVLGPAIKGLLDLINSVLTAATAAVAKLTEMFQMNRARTQARKELGGVMGRGTVKADPAEVEARALEIFETQQAASAAAAAAATATQPPANAILPTGNLTGRTKSELEQQQEAAAKLLKTLEERQTLATALTSDEQKMLQLKIDQANVDEQFPLLSAKARDNIKEQLEALYAQENVTQALKDAADDRAKKEKEIADKQAEQAKKLEDLYKNVGTAIENSIVDGIMRAIDGTQTLQETVSGLLKDIGKMFLQFAVRGLLQGTGLPMFAAEGGYVSGPTNTVVGEGGESEYIIPESKMRESMARYSRGARGSAVIPETGASGTSGEGGGTAVAAPIDVRYTVERINSVDYVTADQFESGMRQAADQGARQGEQRALLTLRQNTSQRRRIGI